MCSFTSILVFRFQELDKEAQTYAYKEYLKAMDDDLNRDNVVSFDEYSQGADWDGLTFDIHGNAQ